MISGAIGEPRELHFGLLCQAPDCRNELARIYVPAPTWIIQIPCSRCGAMNAFKGTPYGTEAAITSEPKLMNVPRTRRVG